MHASLNIHVSIARDPDAVYDFISSPQNLPAWAAGLCLSVERSGDDWIAQTAQGPMRFRFVEKNAFRVADHSVFPAPGVEVHVPLRVLANGTGCDVVLTLFRQPGMSDEKYAEDAALVERDLQTLKRVLETGLPPAAAS